MFVLVSKFCVCLHVFVERLEEKVECVHPRAADASVSRREEDRSTKAPGPWGTMLTSGWL